MAISFQIANQNSNSQLQNLPTCFSLAIGHCTRKLFIVIPDTLKVKIENSVEIRPNAHAHCIFLISNITVTVPKSSLSMPTPTCA